MADGPVAEQLLRRLEAADGGLDSAELAAQLGVEHQAVVGAVKSLQALGEVIEAELRSTKRWELTAEGEEMAREGSHEARVFQSVPAEGLAQSELMRLPSGKVGFSKAMSNKWIRVDKSAAEGPRVFRTVEGIDDEVQRRLQLVQGGQAEKLAEKERSELRKRKLLTEVTLKTYWVSKGKAFSTSISKQEAELSPDMISSGSWQNRSFKPYNFAARGVPPDSGHLHPLLKVRSQFRQIFLEMGFTEMPTDNFIESSFWNFDALFQPQQHPARDQHDTFFLRDPAEALQLPMDYVQRVKRTHSQGGYGSQGYKYSWKLDEAKKNLLRTHTTSASARALYRLAQKKPFTPAKYFSIDRVFRNETLDATHLAEFHQIEGVVADHGLNLGHLMGVLREFFTKLAITVPCRNHAAPLQASLQPLHGAQHGGVQLPSRPEEVGGSWELRPLSPRDAAAYGAPGECVGHCLGALAGAPHHDQVRHQQHPGAGGPQGEPADGVRQSPVPPGRGHTQAHAGGRVTRGPAALTSDPTVLMRPP
ncbi:PREDICTED: phenylalanine--tRNA ligase alpha subunit isoform X1 [Dipodomys ordii]|uniref:Phenylalanine--tRNA ligase alpha subunit n=1 Tax=Dipodomys ordii TaxID=10020 RepID=A0A1S3GLF2_DIPOR|nr:PREDICTED: phenylalanine--tRNA ligase alpha subunit isoform X1 [Dipodomys ordii]